MATKNYYEILGVNRDSTHEEIKQAYETLKHVYAVIDKPKEEIDQLKEAYAVLINPVKRKIYDLYLNFPRNKSFSFGTALLRFQSSTPTAFFTRERKERIKKRLPSKDVMLRSALIFFIMFCFVITLPYLLINITVNYHFKKAVESYNEGQYNSALVSLNQSIYDFGRKNVDACLLSGKILIEQFHEYDYALQYIDKGLHYASDDVERASLYFLKGKCLKKKGMHQDALFAFETSAGYNEKNDSAFFELGELETFIFNNYQNGIENYNKSLLLNSELEEAYLGRGYCYQQLQLHRKAIDDFDSFISLNEYEGMVFFLKAVSEMELNATKEACSNFARASKLGINGADVYLKSYCDSLATDKKIAR